MTDEPIREQLADALDTEPARVRLTEFGGATRAIVWFRSDRLGAEEE